MIKGVLGLTPEEMKDHPEAPVGVVDTSLTQYGG
jgi:hypothetical protein